MLITLNELQSLVAKCNDKVSCSKEHVNFIIVNQKFLLTLDDIWRSSASLKQRPARGRGLRESAGMEVNVAGIQQEWKLMSLDFRKDGIKFYRIPAEMLLYLTFMV